MKTQNEIDNSELPKGWKWVRLGDVCEKPEYGYTASSSNEKVGPKLLRITDIQNGKVDWDKVPYCQCDKDYNRYLLKPGDILFARTGGTTGKSYLINNVPAQAIFASYLIRVQVKNNSIPEYLYLFLQSSFYWEQVGSNKRGGAQPNMNATLLADVLLPLPSLAEQKQIVAKVQELMAEVEKLQTAISKSQSAIDSLSSSYLNQVFSSPEAKKWERKKLGDLCTVKTGKKDVNEGAENGKYPFYTCADEPLKSDTFSFEGESIILPGNGANVGLVLFYNGKFEAYQRTYVLNKFSCLIEYAYYHLIYSWKKHNLDKQSGSATNYIRLGNIQNYPISIPSLSVQEQIVKSLQAKMSEVEKLKSKIYNLQSAIASLPQSILRKAFRGEL